MRSFSYFLRRFPSVLISLAGPTGRGLEGPPPPVPKGGSSSSLSSSVALRFPGDVGALSMVQSIAAEVKVESQLECMTTIQLLSMTFHVSRKTCKNIFRSSDIAV